jgi:hypothetical protein
MGETRELDFMTTITIIKAYKKRIAEIDAEATVMWGEYFYEDYAYRCNRLAEERDICTLMASYYTEKINESICLN